MKKLLLPWFMCLSIFAQAQTNVYFKISHKLGNQTLTAQTTANNNLNNNFNVSRLEYYVSNIILIHDSGTETPVAGTYILANAFDSTNVLLGNFNVTNLEAVRFSIGVDAATNHLDPSSYPANHPLAPKSPSMHWGWASGYRFVAMGGKTGASLALDYEIHALEDVNYFTQTIATAGIAGTNQITVGLVADYTQALWDINIGNGEVNHGSTGSALDLLRNFALRVFKSSEGNAALGFEEENKNQEMAILPNPSAGFEFVILQNVPENSTVLATDVLGKTITLPYENGKIYVGNLTNGLYFIRATNIDGQHFSSKFVVVH